MVCLQSNADPLPHMVIMVTGHMGQHSLTTGQSQGVQKLGAAKSFAQDFSFHWRIIVMHDVICPQQNFADTIIRDRLLHEMFVHIL